jgi:alcohol dehydrogenase
MQQVTFIEPGKVEWREVSEPAVEGPGEALVRPLAVATCDLDAAMVAGASPFQGPFPLGHEFVAEVVEAGEEVEGWVPGDVAVVPFQISCGACEACRRGRTGNCREVRPRGSMYGIGPAGGEWGGALTDLVRVPFADPMLLPVPVGTSPAALASASDNISDAYRTVAEPLRAEPGAEVLIVGGFAASISLYAVAIAVALGAGAVHFLDHDPERLALAESLGGRPIEAAGPEDLPERVGPYPITVEANGSDAGLACALRSTAPDGTCTSVAIHFGAATPVPLFEMYFNGVTFHTSRVHSRGVLPEVLELIAAGRIDPERVITDVVPWEAAAEEWARPRTKLIVARES